jgi:hypothetical protein
MNPLIPAPSALIPACKWCQAKASVVEVRHDGHTSDSFCGDCLRQWAQGHREALPAALALDSRCGASRRDGHTLRTCRRPGALAVTSYASSWTVYVCLNCIESFASHY